MEATGVHAFEYDHLPADDPVRTGDRDPSLIG
jgi:hypothetical protein